ncbi:uncharacterized protein LOC135484728 isoform X2 [Lineus longissimus]
MAFSLNQKECDLTVQGAVILGSGGGGPLPFARKIIAEITSPAEVKQLDSVHDDDWLTMIALVGQPSKVHDVLPGRHVEAFDVPDGPVRNDARMPKFAVNKDAPLSFFVNGPLIPKSSVDVVDSSDFDSVDGSTASDGVVVNPNVAARNALRFLQAQCRLRAKDPDDYPRFQSFQKLTHLLTGELGAVNIAVSLYLSSAMNIPVADCDGAGRSVPLISQITYADRFNVSPTVIVSPLDDKAFESIASVTLDFPAGTEGMVQLIAKSLLSSEEGPFAHGYIGYGTYVVSGAEVRGVPVENSLSMAFEIGKVLNESKGRKRADDICAVMQKYKRDCAVVFHGNISDKLLHDDLTVHDIGYVTVRDDDSSEMQLWYKNEVMLAGPKGQPPKYMAPDSICIVPAEGEPFDVSTITQRQKEGVEIYVIVIAADEKLKNKKIVESFEKIYELFEDGDQDVYRGRYVPWSASR